MKLFEFFGFQPKKRPSAPPPALPPGTQPVEPAVLLRGVPQLNPLVTRISDRRYGCLLSWPVTLPQAKQRKTAIGRLFAGPQRRRRLVLDDIGRRTIELIDGQRPLTEIASVLARETGHDRQAMEQAVLTFIGQLVRRNAASLAAPKLNVER